MYFATIPPRRMVYTFAGLWGGIHILLSVLVGAQPPVSVCCMAYATINEDIFYIQGGLVKSTPTSQFIALDLTVPTWDTSSPPWKTLQSPASLLKGDITYRHTMSVSPDNQTLSIWGAGASSVIANYGISSNSWSQITPVPEPIVNSGNSIWAATDTTTGLVYLPGAYNNVSMAVYDFSKMALTSAPMPPSVVEYMRNYPFVWSTVRRTFILGDTAVDATDPFVEYSPSTGQWTTLVCRFDFWLLLNVLKVPTMLFTEFLSLIQFFSTSYLIAHKRRVSTISTQELHGPW